MKRALLIAGGTVGGLGAVLAISPPQFNQTTSVGALSGSLGTPAASGKVTTAATTHAPAPAKSAVSKATSKATVAASAGGSSSQPQAVTSAPAATTTAAAPAASGYSGTVTGAPFAARNYGNLSATVTFSNGQITRVSASQSPSSWSQNSLPTLIPYASSGKITVEQIKTYAAEQLPCAISNSCRSQASFTATAFWSSVKSAINKAGL